MLNKWFSDMECEENESGEDKQQEDDNRLRRFIVHSPVLIAEHSHDRAEIDQARISETEDIDLKCRRE